MKAKLYRFHRLTGLIVFLPVVLWSLSGILHPIMANWFKIRPAQKTVQTKQHELDSNRVDPSFIFQKNNITELENIGLTYLNDEEVYQIKQNGNLSYYSSTTGNKIENGDKAYATQLARYYSGDNESPIASIEKITEFKGAYKSINRLLPVYKVTLQRKDGLALYVHTESGELGTLNDTYRNAFLWCFSVFHNWSFLGSNQIVKSIVILLFSLLVFVNGILGLIIYWKNRKAFKAQKKGNSKLKPRKRHRKFSLFASIFLLAFAFSGGYHTFMKFDAVLLNDFEPKTTYPAAQIDFSVNAIIQQSGPITRLSLAEYNGEPFLRTKDTIQNKQPIYFNLADGSKLEEGNKKYATERALQLSGLRANNIQAIEYITNYNREYGFINKRLPVYAIHFNTSDHLSYYIEPATGIPGAIHSDAKKMEALSFIFLHKYHFLNFMGKGWRDLISALAAFSLVIIALTGIIIWLRIKMQKKSKP